MNCIIIIFCIFLVYILWRIWYNTHDESDTIAQLTDQWCETALNKTPSDMVDLFCNNSILLGTVSQTIRDSPESIYDYFNYFMNIQGLEIINKNYNITKINPTTYVNNAYITWVYDGREPFTARMTFVYENTQGRWCLFLLHSSVLPDRVEALKYSNL